MKKLIEFLIAQYNKRHDDKIIIHEPTVYESRVISTLAIAQMEEEAPVFLKNIILEKQFDLRSSLVDTLLKDGCFTEKVEKSENELILTTKIFVYEN